jgi:hypothetical protein
MRLKGRSSTEAENARIAFGLAIDNLRAAARELESAGRVQTEAGLLSEETKDILTRAAAARDALPLAKD